MTGALLCAVASERTCITTSPGRIVDGICPAIWPLAVWSRGISTEFITTQEPPNTVGEGSALATVAEARLDPLMVTNEPGLKVVVPSTELIIGCVVASTGVVAALEGVRGITLRPESVIAYAVPCESTTIWRGGVGWAVLPKKEMGGFSGTRNVDAIAPVRTFTTSKVVWVSEVIVVVKLVRTGVVKRAKLFSSIGATEATLRNPLLDTLTPPPPPMVGGVIVTIPGSVAPPIGVSELFITNPSASRKFASDAAPTGP